MTKQHRVDAEQYGMSGKVKLAMGAASLFFFLVGLKRTFRTDEGAEYTDGGLNGFGGPEPQQPQARGNAA